MGYVYYNIEIRLSRLEWSPKNIKGISVSFQTNCGGDTRVSFLRDHCIGMVNLAMACPFLIVLAVSPSLSILDQLHKL